MLWDPQSPPERNQNAEQVLGMYRKAAKDRERACGHDTSHYACDECKRAKAVSDPQPSEPFVEPTIDAYGNPAWPQHYGDTYDGHHPAHAASGNDKQKSDAWSQYRWRPV
eukprot:12884698-Heterocapsa_arctica.AAC.1